MKTCDLETRRKIVEFILAGGLKTQAVEKFGVSRSTVYRCMKANTSGNLAPKPRAGTKREIDPAKLETEFRKHPGATLSYFAEIFGVHTVTIWHCLQKSGLRLKRSHFSRDMHDPAMK